MIDTAEPFEIISIHTFLAEGDQTTYLTMTRTRRFQSTPSSRKVTYVIPRKIKSVKFQSTPSSRKVTWRQEPVTEILVLFQSTPSSRKVTTVTVFCCAEHNPFQSTPSSRKVTAYYLQAFANVSISIHTFLAEGDHQR